MVRAAEANPLLSASYDIAGSALMAALLLAVLIALAVIALAVRRRRQ